MAEIPGQDDPGVQPTPDDGTRLSITRLLSHLAYEERELIDPLARYGFYDQQIR